MILNKVDRIPPDELDLILKKSKSFVLAESNFLITSFNQRDGIDAIIKKLIETLSYINQANSDVRLARSWHKTVCLSVSSALGRAMALNTKEEPELVAEELRFACDALGRLTGQVAVDDLLDKIFSSFCIGK